MTTQKSHSSLNKLRGRGVIPRNYLNMPLQPIGIPTIDTVNLGAQSIVRPLNMDEPEKSTDAKNCFFMSINLEKSGLTADPSLSFDVKVVDYNGTSIDSDQVGSLRLLVLAQKDFIFLRKERCFIDKMIVPYDAIKGAYFDPSSYSFIFIFQKGFGYWKVTLLESYNKLYDLLQDHRGYWVSEHLRLVSSEKFSQIYDKEVLRRVHSYKDPVTEYPLKNLSESDFDSSGIANTTDDVLRNGLPSNILPEKESLVIKSSIADDARLQVRLTRSHTSNFEPLISKQHDRSLDLDSSDTPFDNDIEETDAIETPASFEPPLRYCINSTKNFIITANDFKTLYNASWVNDTLIDFFIAYEIERAITELHTISRSEIYAFNSFFYTKLISTTGETEEPPYYENIRKWLEKIDLASFKYLVIPIMENAHWFCLVIKGFPALLALAKAEAESKAGADLNQDALNTKALGDAAEIADIFVLDSLRLTHPQSMKPIKIVLREHCKEKHGVIINTKMFKVRYSRVIRQRNTSDCGIHVIFNLKKWLSEPQKCELMWRKRSKSCRYFSNVQGLRLMRRNCIDMLLKLHSEQPPLKNGGVSGDEGEAQSDDDIEEISYHNSEKTAEAKEAVPLNCADKESDRALTKPGDLEMLPEGVEIESSSLNNNYREAHLALPEATTVSSSTSICHKTFGVSGGKSHCIEFEAPKLTGGTELSAPRVLKQHSVDLNTDSQLSNVEDAHDSDFSRLILDRFMDNAEEVNSMERDTSKKSRQDRVKESFEKATEEYSGTFYTKTLDPRVSEKINDSSSDTEHRVEFVQIEHPQVRKWYMRMRLMNQTMRYLNRMFSNHEKTYGPDRMATIMDLVDSYESCVRLHDTETLNAVKTSFNTILKDPPAPKDASFVIEEESDNRDLNRSVGDLRIADEDESGLASIPSGPLEIESHTKFKTSEKPQANVSTEGSSDVEVVTKDGYKSSPRHRVTRRDGRSKQSMMKIIPSEIEIFSDSDDDISALQRMKTRQFSLHSPKRRRLDRRF